ncbi:hypothetical protein PSZ24_23630, partial [Shigella flexneri]|nr:hypothetical protein [Shigella flexneri]
GEAMRALHKQPQKLRGWVAGEKGRGGVLSDSQISQIRYRVILMYENPLVLDFLKEREVTESFSYYIKKGV